MHATGIIYEKLQHNVLSCVLTTFKLEKRFLSIDYDLHIEMMEIGCKGTLWRSIGGNLTLVIEYR